MCCGLYLIFDLCLFRNGLLFWMESVISASPTGQLGKVKELKVTQLFFVLFLFVCLFLPFFANLFQPLVWAAFRVQSLKFQSEKKVEWKTFCLFLRLVFIPFSSNKRSSNFLLLGTKKNKNIFLSHYFRLKRRNLALGVCLQCGEVSPWCLPTSLSASPCL